MPTLDTGLRRQLERTVVNARQAAEAGAEAALRGLAVHERAPYNHMGADERELRRRLRTHARQLGDRRDPSTGEQTITRLIHECAYEHWHGMLFARFLAENNLLIDPDLDIPVSLDECEELAREEADGDKWRFAARLAHAMLPQVFRPDHPAFEVRLAREHRLNLERLVESVPEPVFKASDSLGWVYQFWQSRKKAEVNRSEAKIGADELPAVTQLFTEPYMVSFLLDNALGAWWAARRLSAEDLRNATTEQELRDKAALPGMPLDYLRFVREEDGPWRVAAGGFDAWPANLSELKVMDPCCGSGHFLVAAFAMLVPMRMERDGLPATDAVASVLRENLHGLELDPRCVELAAFALAVTAWRYPGAGGYRALPELSIACSGLSVGVARERWLELADGDHDLRIALGWLHDEFRDASVLGSLLDPSASDAAKIVDHSKLVAALDRARADQQSGGQRETAIVAHGLARAASLMTARYCLVATNVPYLGRRRQVERLRAFCESRYAAAKSDLATAFLVRCLELCARGGTTTVVMPQNWLFQSYYRRIRARLLEARTWHLLARLGPGAFETISGEVVKTVLLTLGSDSLIASRDHLLGLGAGHRLLGLDVSDTRATAKAERLREDRLVSIVQQKQQQNPDARVVLADMSGSMLSTYASAHQGVSTGDRPAKARLFWEQPKTSRWTYMQSTVRQTMHFGGMEWVLDWQHQGGDMAALRGMPAWQRRGIAVSQIGALPVVRYLGATFDTNVSALPIDCHSTELAIWCFCVSGEYQHAVRHIDQKLNVTNATLVKVPFDLDDWRAVADAEYPNGLPQPFTDDPTQWVYHGHPTGSVVWDEQTKRTAQGLPRTEALVLQVAVARLLGYRWPAEDDPDMELAPEQRELARRCTDLLPFGDADGIVCIPSVRGEPPAAERLQDLLRAAYADAWHDETPNRLVAHSGSSTLDDWLRMQRQSR